MLFYFKKLIYIAAMIIIIIGFVMLGLAIWGVRPNKTIQYYQIAKSSLEVSERKEATKMWILNSVVSVLSVATIIFLAVVIYLMSQIQC
jgi:4-hydroxybenzoate polyprenyltransferase